MRRPVAGPCLALALSIAAWGDGTGCSGAAPCDAGLSGTSPFGRTISGTGSFRPGYGTEAAISSVMSASIYFPAGRIAGAPVQLAVQSPVVPSQYFFGPPVTLASDLSATGLTVGGHDLQITGNLLPGAGGLQATVSANFSSPDTDVADHRSAAMLMCPTGDVPTPALQISGGTVSPLSTLGLNSTTPLTTEALGALRITSPLGAVAFAVSPDGSSPYPAGPNFTVAPASAFPPGQPLTFDASGVKDVLGREVPLTLAEGQVLATTTVISDLTLATAPPAEATACSGCSGSGFAAPEGGPVTGTLRCSNCGTVADGVLRIAPAWGPYGSSNLDALWALPATSATKLRVRLAVGEVGKVDSGCFNGNYYASMRTGTMAAVGPSGETSGSVNLTCDGAMADHLLDLPSASPLWLVVHVEGYPARPYYGPMPGSPSVSVDELEFM